MRGTPGQPSKSHPPLEAGSLGRDKESPFPRQGWQEPAPSLCTVHVPVRARQACNLLPSLLPTHSERQQGANKRLAFRARLPRVRGEGGAQGHFLSFPT